MVSQEAEQIVEFFGPSNGDWYVSIYSSKEDSDDVEVFENILEFAVGPYRKDSLVQLLQRLYPQEDVSVTNGRDGFFIRVNVENHKKLFEDIGTLYNEKYPRNQDHREFDHHCYSPAFGYYTM